MLSETDRERGLLLNLTGDGKGKSSSAFGMVIRALGWNWRPAVIQLLKGARETGERNFFHTRFPELIFESYGLGRAAGSDEQRAAVAAGWARARTLLRSFEGELLVLDELNVALHRGYLELDEVLTALRNRRRELNVVVTGRYAPPELLAISDLVSEIRALKHPYWRGVPARKGLDY